MTREMTARRTGYGAAEPQRAPPFGTAAVIQDGASGGQKDSVFALAPVMPWRTEYIRRQTFPCI